MEDIRVMPHTEAIIPAKILDYSGGSTLEIIQANHLKAIPGLMVGKVLTELCSDELIVPVRVANVAEEARDVVAGADLVKCELVSCVTDQNVAENQSTDSSDKCRKLPGHLKTLYRNSVEDLTTEYQKTKVYNLLCNNADLFSKGSNDIGRTDLVKHKINTGSAKPIKQAPRRLPFAKREAADQAVAKMQEHDVIEPSTSPWSSPVVLVQKKDGSLRFCVDYRKLNNVTLKDSYPLPRIDDTLDALGGSQWFSTLDLKSWYWQVELDRKDKEKTAFSVGGGLWQFRVMPFGLCNAPAT